MLIQSGNRKSQRFLSMMDTNSSYSDAESHSYVIDHKWSLVTTHYDQNKWHVSISMQSGRQMPTVTAITYISQLGLFPYRPFYLLSTHGSNTVHFDIQE
ncbi:hypothetical protein [Lactiplantibacillus plantarum]|uniref:hypothetical protein n=1 Tax=Lactiplantibacillus plantarum TaxID=1590 RepID=UPI000BE3A0F3|nr:hypothetical protein [Lactiplantibacillus plantarum]